VQLTSLPPVLPPGLQSQATRTADWMKPAQADARDPVPLASALDEPTVAPESIKYTPTVTSGNGATHQAPPGGRRRPRRRTVLIGGLAVLVIAAAGIVYAVRPSGSSPKRPSKPILVATLAIPGGGTASYAQFSPDGSLIAAVGTSDIYVWNADSHAYLATLIAPDVTIGTITYAPAVDGMAFSADDGSLTASVGPAPSKGESLPRSVPHIFYRWDIATGKRSTVGSISVPSADDVSFSAESGTAFFMVSKTSLRVMSLSHGGGTFTLLGAAQYVEPDQDGNRILYDSYTKAYIDTVYVLDASNGQLAAKLNINSAITGYSSLSPNGATAIVTPATSIWFTKGVTIRPWELWDVATGSNISPSDPRWQSQAIWGAIVFSTDSSVIATTRAGGKTDLWNVAEHRYLLTVSDPNYRKDGYVEAVGPGGREIMIAGLPVAGPYAGYVSGFKQLRLWETPLGPA
jgi:WD40 repeat protein